MNPRLGWMPVPASAPTTLRLPDKPGIRSRPITMIRSQPGPNTCPYCQMPMHPDRASLDACREAHA